MKTLVALCWVACGLVSVAYAAEYQATRVSAFDWQCQDAAGTKVSDHQREGAAVTACANLSLKDGKTRYVQGGRYRIQSGVTPEPVPTPVPVPVPTPSGSATLTWIVPTTNTDGTPLTDLKGYRVYYGRSNANLENNVDIAAGVSQYTVKNLSAGAWYFAIVALAANAQSDFSPIIAKTVQ